MTELENRMTTTTDAPQAATPAATPSRPVSLKEAILVGGGGTAAMIVAAWQWADNVTSELAAIKTQNLNTVALVERVSRMEIESARTEAFKLDIARRLERIEEKLDRLAERK